MRVVTLRRWLPLLLIGVTLVRLALLAWTERQGYLDQLSSFTDGTAHAQLLQNRRNLEDILRERGGVGLETELSELGLDPLVRHAALIDDTGRVVVATRFAWKGRPASRVIPGYPDRLAREVRLARRERLVLDQSRDHLEALAPVRLSARPGELRSHRIGLLLIDYDFTPLKADAWQSSLRYASIFGGMMVLMMLLLIALGHRFILVPVRALSDGMSRIGTGDFDALPAMRGHGEFKVLGDAMAAMATALRASRAELEESEARYRHLSDAATEAIFIHDGGIIVDANAAAGRLVGMAPDLLKGRDIYGLVAEHDRQRKHELTKQGVEGSWPLDFLDAHGAIVPTEVNVRQWRVGDRNLRVVAAHDIRERIAAEAEIRQLSNFDPLTGLPNRRLLLARVAQAVEDVDGDDRHASLATFNLDGFNVINESLGMAAGDAVLRAVAMRLTGALRHGQMLARVDGDTFAVLLPDLDAAIGPASEQASRWVEELLGQLAEPLELHGQILHLSAGAGLVMIPNDSRDPAELLREAETAMHRSKLAADSRVRFFAHDLQEAATARLTLRTDLKQAIVARDQLLLHFQPQIDAQDQLRGVEALVRWQHPTRGMIPPGDFIGEAEASGLIVPLGNWVMQEAVACMLRCEAELGLHTLAMAVNVSPRQFREPDFVPRVEDLLARLGDCTLSLEIELTESVAAEDLEATLEKMQLLRRHGVKLALDDFGTGYSSLSYLKRLPIDTLKIDRSFVMDIDAPAPRPGLGKRPAALIEAIIAMAHQLDMQVLAEGVETPAQHAHLLQAGCDIFQGFLFSRPLTESGMHAWIRGRDGK
jgi:diguanylate cyclase (GGDEF)-like protein/PAS domain S-box-containing protein